MTTSSNPGNVQAFKELDEAIDALDPVVALMSLIQITGDRSLLQCYGDALEGTQHTVKEAFVAFGEEREPPGEAALRTAQIVRDLLREAVKSGKQPLMPHPDKRLFHEMANRVTGVEIPAMSVEPAFQHAGFTTDTRVREPVRLPSEDFKVLVVGAGMMGINAAVKLQQAGFDFTVVEKLDAVGGNWLENTYPGAAVDTPSRVYSFSFEPNASWSKYYPNGPEFLSYLERVTDKYSLRDRIHFGTRVDGAAWDEVRKLWTVSAERGGEQVVYEVNALIMAVGPNNEPNYPKVENLDTFKGPVVHSAHWDHSVDLKGKKVVLVGTGCSGVQVATAIAGQVGELVIVQRQPEHILPNPTAHDPVDPLEIRAMERVPFAAQWKRLQSLASQLTDMHGMVLKDEQYAAETGGFGPINDGMRMLCEGYLQSHFPDDPELVAMLTPNFPVFSKRPILDCGFYDTLKKPNVSIVRGALQGADENAVILDDGTRIECDVLLLSTGYKLHFGRQFDIVGRDSKRLRDVFDPYPFSYEGMLVPGFPNFILGGGPYSFLVANHAVVSEQQMHYAIELLQWMVDDGLSSVDVTQKATDAFVEDVDSNLQQSAWVQCGNAHGYYRDQGKKVILAIPRHNSRIWHDLRVPRQEDFRVTRWNDAEPATEPEMTMLTI
ncbi:flavin-containing monooxygenase [Parahaliea aestuarii]|uniref:NAD(P)/FAD-dependent oxidoreductase n=1 Tax=Parahaliea aestuarii TaxID=1852021 RepID=A0A5C9A108_9GAMM|nr:NAD(P)/FAD-dependent oxidoreductase [Parahaliea aestuarii]TXS93101.1 NAD(P)/FAD-dependent oxidoreductase [Parahaliea aestuarii]